MRAQAIFATSVLVFGSLGCMDGPRDGTVVRTNLDASGQFAGATLRFSAFYPLPNMTASIYAQDNSGRLRAVGTATSGSNSLGQFWGIDWYRTNPATIELPPEFWTTGARGRYATLLANQSGFLGVRQDAPNCFQQFYDPDDYDLFAQQCTEPTVLVCTDDFVARGSTRRFGCPPRQFSLLTTSGTSEELVSPGRTRTSSRNVRNVFTSGTRYRWRGDRASFVDVFSSDYQSLIDPLKEIWGVRDGLGGGLARRVRAYPWPSNDSQIDEQTFPASFVPRAVRAYDIGECSAVVSYRAIVAQVFGMLDDALARGDVSTDEVHVHAFGHGNLTPIPRITGEDLIGFSYPLVAQVQVSPGSLSVEMTINMSVAITARDGAITAELHHLHLDAKEGGSLVTLLRVLGFGSRLREQVENLRRAMEAEMTERFAEIQGAFSLPLGLQVHRTHLRPEGLELVLAEDRADPWYIGLNLLGACRRPNPIGEGPREIPWGVHIYPALPTRPRMPSDTLDDTDGFIIGKGIYLDGWF